MPLNIRWKGYPRNRLPRIRVASPSNSIHGKVVPTEADDPFRVPLGPSLEKERKRQRQRQCRRRRGRKSGSSSARRRAVKSSRTVHGPEHGSTGYVTPNTEIVRKIRGQSSHKAEENRRNPSLEARDYGRGPVVGDPEKRPSLGTYPISEVPEDSSYYTSTGSIISSEHGTAGFSKDREQSAHPEPLNTVSGNVRYGKNRSRSYDPRIYQRQRSRSISTSIHFPTPSRHHSRSAPEDCENWNKEAFLEAIATGVTKARDPSTRGTSIKSVVRSILSDVPSRSPSQKKALYRFTKELELYLQAARSMPKQSFVTSPSITSASIYTIQELKPYREDFESVGLAITSTDQKKRRALDPEKRRPHLPHHKLSSAQEPSKAMSAYRSHMKDTVEPFSSTSDTPKSFGTDFSNASLGTVKPAIRGRYKNEKEQPYLGPSQPSKPIIPTLASTISPDTVTPPHTPARKLMPWLRKPDSPFDRKNSVQSYKRAAETSPSKVNLPVAIDSSSNKESTPRTIIRTKYDTDKILVDGDPKDPYFNTPSSFKQALPARTVRPTLSSQLKSTRKRPAGDDAFHLAVPWNLTSAPFPQSDPWSAGYQELPSNDSRLEAERQLPLRDGCPSVFEPSLREVIRGVRLSEPKFPTGDKFIRSDSNYREPCDYPRPLEATLNPSLNHPSAQKVSGTLAANQSSTPSSIPYREILNGLRMATAAVCDKKLDDRIMQVTGTGVRQFLADLGGFDPLFKTAPCTTPQRAMPEKQDEARICEANEAQSNPTQALDLDALPVRKQRNNDPSTPIIASKTPPTKRGAAVLLDRMARIKDTRDGEDMRMRAVAMGWREMASSVRN